MAHKIKPKDSEDLYKSLFYNMPDGLAYCQMIFAAKEKPVDYIYVTVNKNFEKLTGLKDVIGKKVTELIPGINISDPELLETYGRVSLTGEPEKFETYIEPVARWFLVSVYSSKKKFFIAVFRNITDQKQIEKELKNARIAAQNVLEDLQAEKEKLAEAKAKDEAVLASIGDGMIATSKDGNVIIMNHTAEVLLGCTAKDFLGKQVREMIHVCDDKGANVQFEKLPIQIALSTGKTTTTTTTTYYYERKDGKKFPVAIAVNPIMLNNNIVGAVEIFRDVTREQEIEKAKSEFVSTASHELRTPLTAIDGLVSMILDGEYGEVNKELMQPLSDVNTSSERLIHLVNDLLSLSRLQAGKLTYTLSEIDIKPIVEGIVKMLQVIAEPKGLKLSAPNIGPTTVLADVNKMEQILDNLIGNSLKFTDKGSIVLSTKITENNVIIFITDTGIGIGKEDLGKLFGRFEKLESGLGRAAGTGLGLHISREVARRMGGDVWLEKSEVGIGSTFAFSLPLAKSQLAVKVKEEIEREAQENPDKKAS